MCLLGSCAESSLFEILVCRPFGIKPPSKPMPTSNDLRFIYLSWVNYHKWQFIPFSWDISLYKRVTTWGVVINRAFLFAYVCGVGQAFFQRYSAMPTKTKANQWVATMQPLVHDDVIKWKQNPCYWPFARGIHRSPVNYPHKGQWRGDLMFALICAWINRWVNNREAGDLRRHRDHYDVIVIVSEIDLKYTLFIRTTHLKLSFAKCRPFCSDHYSDVAMRILSFQITCDSTVCLSVY